MTQTIVAVTIVLLAVGFAIFSVLKKILSGKQKNNDCVKGCEGCPLKDKCE